MSLPFIGSKSTHNVNFVTQFSLLNKLKKLNFMDIYNKNEAANLEKINNVRNFFKYENQQVDTIIALMWVKKAKRPLGLTFLEIIDELRNENRYFLYKTNVYLRSLLNTLAQPGIDILELSELNNKFNITRFGLDYYFEGDNAYT
jgi:hypothetical protein